MLRRFLRKAGGAFETSPPVEVIERAIDFYGAKAVSGLAREADEDMLLFQYGCYDWGDGEYFEIDVTRQFVAADEARTMSQLGATLYFAPEPELRRLGAHDLWCRSRGEATDFHAAVLGDPAITLIRDRPTLKRVVAWGVV